MTHSTVAQQPLRNNTQLHNSAPAVQSAELAQLAQAGATFTHVSRGSKAPPAGNWQHTPHKLPETLKHLHAGGNAGLLCGHYSAGLCMIDLDDRAPLFRERYPELCRWAVHRQNAPERGKYIFRAEGPLVGRKSQAAGIELLAASSTGGGNNAILAGVHPSGAPIELDLRGDVPTLPPAVAQAIFDAWAAEFGKREAPAAAARPAAAYSRPSNAGHDYDAAAEFLGRLHSGRADDYGDWIAVGMALSELGGAGLQLWDEWSAQSPKYTAGACARKWKTFRAGGKKIGLGTLARMADQDSPRPARASTEHPPPAPPVDDGTVPAGVLIDAAGAWILSAECAAQLRTAGYKRIENPRRILAGLLQLARERNGLALAASVRTVADAAGVGHSSAAAHLVRLAEAGLLKVRNDKVLVLEFVVRNSDSSFSAAPGVENHCPSYAQQTAGGFYPAHLTDEAFMAYPYRFAYLRRGGPLLPASIGKPYPDATGRRRWDGRPLPSGLGSGELLAWHSLAAVGELTCSELSACTGMRPGAAGAALRRLERAGYVDAARECPRAPKVYALRDDAGARLEEMRPHMPSYGVKAMRARRDELARANWADMQMRQCSAGDEREKAQLLQKRRKADAQAATHAATLDALGIDYGRRVGTPTPGGTKKRNIAAVVLEGQAYDARDLVETWFRLGEGTPGELARRMIDSGYTAAHAQVARLAARHYPNMGIVDEIRSMGALPQLPPPPPAQLTLEREPMPWE